MKNIPSAKTLNTAIRENNLNLQDEFERVAFATIAEEMNGVLSRTNSEPLSRIGSYTVLRFETRFSWCDTENIMAKMREMGYKVVFSNFGPGRNPGTKPSIEIHWSY